MACVLDRHAVLRTTYEVAASDGAFAQRVHVCIDGGVSAVREVHVADADAAGSIVGADASRGFELLSTDRGEVLRCLLVRVDGSDRYGSASQQQLMHINVHHVAFDGASTGVFLGELGAVHVETPWGSAGAPCALLACRRS